VEARDLGAVEVAAEARDLVAAGVRDLDLVAAGARDLVAVEAPHLVAGVLVAAARAPAQAAIAERERAIAEKGLAVAEKERTVEETARAPAERDQMAEREQMAERDQTAATRVTGPPATRVAEGLVSIPLTLGAALVAAALGGVVIRLLARSLESPTMRNVVASTRKKRMNSEEAFRRKGGQRKFV
jgi:hypothetical protein